MGKAGQAYFIETIRKAIEYCAMEYDMTWVEAIGCLHMAAHHYAMVAFKPDSFPPKPDYPEDDDDLGYNDL